MSTCKNCSSSYRIRTGAIGKTVPMTVWECGECKCTFTAKPTKCTTGCGYIDSHCRCEHSISVGYPRLSHA